MVWWKYNKIDKLPFNFSEDKNQHEFIGKYYPDYDSEHENEINETNIGNFQNK